MHLSRKKEQNCRNAKNMSTSCSMIEDLPTLRSDKAPAKSCLGAIWHAVVSQRLAPASWHLSNSFSLSHNSHLPTPV